MRSRRSLRQRWWRWRFGAGGDGFGENNFCDASGVCTGGIGVNGIPWGFGPGYIGGQFGPGVLLAAEAGYVARVNYTIEGNWLAAGFIVQRGPGGSYYNPELAMAAAALLDAEATSAELANGGVVHEYYSYLIADADGTFSYAAPFPGDPCTQMPDGQLKCRSFFDSDVPGNYFGIAHSHPDDTPFSPQDELTYNSMNSTLNRPWWGVLAPVGVPGQVLVFNPITWSECVLVGPTNTITPNSCH